MFYVLVSVTLLSKQEYLPLYLRVPLLRCCLQQGKMFYNIGPLDPVEIALQIIVNVVVVVVDVDDANDENVAKKEILSNEFHPIVHTL